MAFILFDNAARSSLYPLTYTKAIASLRFGIFTIQERWQQLLGEEIYIQTADYLQCLHPLFPEGIHTWIDAGVVPADELIEKIKTMRQGDVYEDERGVIACKGSGKNVNDILENAAMNFTTIEVQRMYYLHEIVQLNEAFINFDFKLITKDKTSAALSSTNRCLAQENIFVESGARIEFAIINATAGPVYIGANATVMEGCLLRGPLCIGDNAVIKMGARIYGATTIGPNCAAGGEIKNSVLQSNSNKAHDGYLGDSIVGEWCNIGAGASNSNVKNTADDIRLWYSKEETFVNAGNKCGVVVGDYTRIAINSSINTGSVYGISCNVFGDGLLPTQLRNFSWGAGGEGYAVDKAIKHIRQWKHFKQQLVSIEEESVLKYIFDNFMNE